MRLLGKSVLPWLLMLGGAIVIIGAPKAFIEHYAFEENLTTEAMLGWVRIQYSYEPSDLVLWRMVPVMALGVTAIFVGVHLRQMAKLRW